VQVLIYLKTMRIEGDNLKRQLETCNNDFLEKQNNKNANTIC